jgi:hypothetical protein
MSALTKGYWADASVQATTASQTALVANTARNYVVIQNLDATNNVGFRVSGTSTAETAVYGALGSFVLTPGGSLTSDVFSPSGAITVITNAGTANTTIKWY